MDERKRISLGNVARKHPFQVPEGYFDTLSSQIMENAARLENEAGTRPLPVPPKRNVFGSWWRAPAVAASIALVGGLIWFTLPVRQGPLGPDELAAVSDEAILTYLASQDLDYEYLASQDVVQKAFSDESTLLPLLDEVDESVIREQLLENTMYDEAI